jgi:hypothetical protein
VNAPVAPRSTSDALGGASLSSSVSRMIRTLAILGLSTLFLSGCDTKSQTAPNTFVIADVAKTSTNILLSGRRFGDLSGITLHVYGELQGTGKVAIEQYPAQRLTGVVDWRIYRDWFETNCTFYWVPSGVVTGHLSVDYSFH